MPDGCAKWSSPRRRRADASPPTPSFRRSRCRRSRGCSNRHRRPGCCRPPPRSVSGTWSWRQSPSTGPLSPTRPGSISPTAPYLRTPPRAEELVARHGPAGAFARRGRVLLLPRRRDLEVDRPAARRAHRRRTRAAGIPRAPGGHRHADRAGSRRLPALRSRFRTSRGHGARRPRRHQQPPGRGAQRLLRLPEHGPRHPLRDRHGAASACGRAGG